MINPTRVDPEYYRRDPRYPLLSIALLQLLGLIMVLVAFPLFLWDWPMALGLLIAGFMVAIWAGNLGVRLSHAWLVFNGSRKIPPPVLYCEIEDPDTAHKIKFVPESVGGLYRENGEMVLGTIHGERRCRIEDFRYECVHKSMVINYINAVFNHEVISLVPKWDGAPKDCPDSPSKAKWGAAIIQSMLDR